MTEQKETSPGQTPEADTTLSAEGHARRVATPLTEAEDSPAAPPEEPQGPALPEDSKTLRQNDFSAGSDPVDMPAPDRTDPLPPPPLAPEPKRRGPFLPILGGLIAAGIGYGAAQYMPAGWPIAAQDPSAQAALEERLARAETALSQLPAAPDTAPLLARIDALEAELAARPTGGAADEGRLNALATEIEELRNRPLPEPQILTEGGADLTGEIAALKAELEGLKAGLADSGETDSLRAEIEALRAATLAEREATEARAAELAREAETRASATRSEAAALRLATAIDAGTSLEAALQDLSAAGFTLPQDLQANAAGVRTMAALQQSFPEAARAALAAEARPPEGAGLGDRVTAFLFSQANVRSLHPQEGTDADAVLSRMEAAIGANNLSAALTAAGTLSPAAAAAPAMATWLSEARARQEAAASAAALLQSAAQ
ncbi:COG4223 family protein [Falsigemmobacter faecalis]|uniref:Inner membrane protein n=1 Tax=Falsigemmobacter faecalis TaxID=2488730 RepID=A0A3P3DQM8_9RHOB|nr:hypothetical protein [Falsigemmobacter faecalis]RRH76573.1 hypothetical protein EG244_05215 [Falsigemmobacter faecalis]